MNEYLRFACRKARSTSKQQKSFPRLGTAARARADQIILLPEALFMCSTVIITCDIARAFTSLRKKNPTDKHMTAAPNASIGIG